MQRSIETESVSWASFNKRARGHGVTMDDGTRRRPKNAKRKTLRTHRRGR